MFFSYLKKNKKISNFLLTFIQTSVIINEQSRERLINKGNAEVAELADAQASGACGSNIVWVQVPSSALFFYSKKETDTVSFFSVLMTQKTSDNGKSSMWFHYRNEFRLLSYIPAFSDKNKDLHISHRQLLFSFWH